MSRSEVEKVFGCPPGDYSRGLNRMTAWHDTSDLEPGWYFLIWRSEHAMCQIYFDAGDRLLFFSRSEAHEALWIERAWKWLGF